MANNAFTPGTKVSRDELAEAISCITGMAGQAAFQAVGFLASEHDNEIPASIAEETLDDFIAQMIADELA